MAANTNPIFPLTPYVAGVSLITNSACTSRQPITTPNTNMPLTPIFASLLVPAAPANGLRIDKITIKAAATAIGGATTAGLVFVWIDDTTTAWILTEIPIPVVTPSASVASMEASVTFTNLVLAAGQKIWVSSTIAGASAAHAPIAIAFGGAY